MKAEDLRIGNLVAWNGDLKRVSSIDSYCEHGTGGSSRIHSDIPEIKGSGQFFTAFIKDLSGIPLTEEWLIKFGFTELEDGEDVYFLKIPSEDSLNSVEIHISLGGDIWEYTCSSIYIGNHNTGDDFMWFHPKSKTEYVHQLQNLYFALTDTELELSQKHLTEKPTAP